MKPKMSVARCCCVEQDYVAEMAMLTLGTFTFAESPDVYSWDNNPLTTVTRTPLKVGWVFYGFPLTYYITDGALRFKNVDVPQGATITSAIITSGTPTSRQPFAMDVRQSEFPYYPNYAERNHLTNPAVVRIVVEGHDTDNSTDTLDKATWLARARTTANQTFTLDFNAYGGATPPDWDAATEGAWPPSGDIPNVTAIVQEIVNRGGWVAGNGLSLIFTDNGSWRRTSFTGSIASLYALDRRAGGETGMRLEVGYV